MEIHLQELRHTHILAHITRVCLLKVTRVRSTHSPSTRNCVCITLPVGKGGCFPSSIPPLGFIIQFFLYRERRFFSVSRGSYIPLLLFLSLWFHSIRSTYYICANLSFAISPQRISCYVQSTEAVMNIYKYVISSLLLVTGRLSLDNVKIQGSAARPHGAHGISLVHENGRQIF